MFSKLLFISKILEYQTVVKTVGSLVLLIATTIGLFFLQQSLKRKKRRAGYPKDKVILHQFPRGIYAPSASPFVMKLETWLRIAEIPYKNEFSLQMSKKGQVPWITFNGEVCFIMRFIRI
jgi:hypothetical protein